MFRSFRLTLVKFPELFSRLSECKFFPTGSVIVLFSPLLCQSNLKNLQKWTYNSKIGGLVVLGIYSYTYTYILKYFDSHGSLHTLIASKSQM